MKNKPGAFAMVTPLPQADEDMLAHAGTVVEVVKLVSTAMGAEPAWRTSPELNDAFGNTIAWHDDDLMPLHGNPDEKAQETADSIAV